MNTQARFEQVFKQNREFFTENAIASIEHYGIIDRATYCLDKNPWTMTPTFILEAIIDLLETSLRSLQAYKYKIDSWACHLLGYDEDTEQEIFTVTMVLDDNKRSLARVHHFCDSIKSDYFHAPDMLSSENSITFLIYK